MAAPSSKKSMAARRSNWRRWPARSSLFCARSSMFGDGALTFREFATDEPLPLATIHAKVLDFLKARTDVVLYDAQAVNAYVDQPRMAQDVDLVSSRAAELSEEIRAHLNGKFN